MKEERFLEECLSFLEIDKLPKEGSIPFEGTAIVKAILGDGKEGYIIGAYNEQNGSIIVKKTFMHNIYGLGEILSVYPIEEVKQEVDKIKKPNYQQMKKEELIALLEEKEIPYEDSMSKNDLIALLKQ